MIKNLSEIKILYRKIINNYPDLALAQESYLRLIILDKDEHSPEGDAEAESLYQEYVTKKAGSNEQAFLYFTAIKIRELFFLRFL